MWLIPSRGQWKQWSLPSKLTAIGALVGVLSLGLYVAEKSFGLISPATGPRTPDALPVPPISLEFKNPTADPIGIQRRGDFVLWLPQGVDNLRRLPGRYDIESPGDQSRESAVIVGPGSSTAVVAHLQAEYALGGLLDRGAADLEFILRKERGGLVFSGTIPFARAKIESTRWVIDLSRKE